MQRGDERTLKRDAKLVRIRRLDEACERLLCRGKQAQERRPRVRGVAAEAPVLRGPVNDAFMSTASTARASSAASTTASVRARAAAASTALRMRRRRARADDAFV